MEWHARPATLEDIPYLTENLRQEDKDEIFAASGKTPEESLNEAFTLPNSGIWVGVYKGNPEIIYGVTNSACPHTGIPWMVCTDKLKESPREFMKKCKRWVNGWNNMFPTLTNFVYEKNELHIRWLEWCGFKLVERFPEYGHTKEPFWQFIKTKE